MSLAELTTVVLGEPLTMDALFDALLEVDGGGDSSSRTDGFGGARVPLRIDAIWVGSIGYESFREVSEFARHVREVGVERLIDVRELPISRRRGYAKSALSEALAAEGVEYVHMRALGNPKAFRDLYKSGRAAEGRRLYEQHLLEVGGEALRELGEHVLERRCARMCVEHDLSVCHREVVLAALADAVDGELEVAELG